MLIGAFFRRFALIRSLRENDEKIVFGGEKRRGYERRVSFSLAPSCLSSMRHLKTIKSQVCCAQAGIRARHCSCAIGRWHNSIIRHGDRTQLRHTARNLRRSLFSFGWKSAMVSTKNQPRRAAAEARYLRKATSQLLTINMQISRDSRYVSLYKIALPRAFSG